MVDPSFLSQARLWAQTFFYVVTALSILAAGAIGIVKFNLFRSGRAFITVNLEASSRPCSSTYMQIGVTARLFNGSRVLATARTLEWECRAVATYDDDLIESKIGEYFSSGDAYQRTESSNSEFPWNVQQRITKTDLSLEIEPNEYSHDNVTFIVPAYCTAVQIRLFIPTPRNDRLGWTAVIYHDTRIT